MLPQRHLCRSIGKLLPELALRQSHFFSNGDSIDWICLAASHVILR